MDATDEYEEEDKDDVSPSMAATPLELTPRQAGGRDGADGTRDGTDGRGDRHRDGRDGRDGAGEIEGEVEGEVVETGGNKEYSDYFSSPVTREKKSHFMGRDGDSHGHDKNSRYKDGDRNSHYKEKHYTEKEKEKRKQSYGSSPRHSR